MTTWPTFTPTSAPFDINEASIETTTAATESTETSSAATTTEEPARTQAPLASSTIVPDVATNIPADTTSTSSSSSSTEAPKTAEPFPTIPVDTSTVISGGSSTEATEAPTTEAPLPTTNVPDIATNIPVDTTSSASISSTTTETPETTTVTASTKPVLATDSVTITEAPGTSSSPVIVVDPASMTSSTAAQASTTEAAEASSDPAIIVDSASGPTIAVDASTTTSSAAAQASTTGATETNVTSSDPTIPLDTTTSSIAAEATSAAATETNSTKEASNTTTTSTTTAKVPTPAPTTKSPTVSPTPIPVLSCPNIFDDFTVIDSKAVLYYSLVPSSFPGASNGLLCTRLEYDGIGWVALAISTNGQMIGSEAIIGLPDEGSVLKYDLNGKSDNLVAPMEDEKQTLRNTLIGQENGRTVMEFTKLLVEDGEIPILENGLNYFLHAKGMDNSLGYHISRWSFELNFKGGNIPSLEQASMSFPTHTPTVWMPTDWPTLYPTSSNFPSVPETKLDNSTEPGFDTLVVNPLADTFVEFGTDKIMGDKGRLKVDGKPERITLLRFDVSSLAGMGANVTKAALRLFAETSSPFGGVVEMFPGNSCSDWEEDTVNWGNSPPCVFGNNTKLLGTFGEVTMNKWNEAELKLDFKNLPPIMTLRISSNLANGVTFLSMDHPNGTMPELRFNYYGEVNSTVATPVVPDTEHPTYFPTLMPTTWMPTAPLAENMVIAATQDGENDLVPDIYYYCMFLILFANSSFF